MNWTFSSKNTRAVLLGVGIVIAAFVAAQVINSPSSSFAESSIWLSYCVLLVAFVAASVLLVTTDVADLTSWWTFMVILQFAVAPVLCALLEVGEIDIYSVKALAYVFAGMIGFWLGARLLRKKGRIATFVLDDPDGRRRRVLLGIAMAALGIAAKLYMLRAGLFFYSADIAQVEASSKYREWLSVLAGFTTYAQVVLAVEYFHGTRDRFVRNAFFATVAASMVFALFSGMKGEVLIIPFLLLIVRKLVTGKMEWRIVGAMALLLVIIFPINASYRTEVHSEGSITSLELGSTAVKRAVNAVKEDSVSDVMLVALQSAAMRLDLLQVIVFLDQDDGRSNIEGDERLWMIPFYPFVPRILWQSKPVLDKGQRLSIAMGSTETSSVAVTPFGDLLLMGGVIAVVIGMICVGMVIQTVTNLVSGSFGPKALLIYAVLFSKFYAPEYDLIMLGTTLLQTAFIAYVLADVVYGGKFFKYKKDAQTFRNPRAARMVS